MDKVVQQIAANAEESAAAEELNAQAEQLKNSVNDLIVVVTGKRTPAGQEHKIGFSRQSASTPKKSKMIGHNRNEIQPDQVIPFDNENEFKAF